MFTTDGLLPKNTRIESLRLQNPFLKRELIDFKDQVNQYFTIIGEMLL